MLKNLLTDAEGHNPWALTWMCWVIIYFLFDVQLFFERYGETETKVSHDFESIKTQEIDVEDHYDPDSFFRWKITYGMSHGLGKIVVKEITDQHLKYVDKLSRIDRYTLRPYFTWKYDSGEDDILKVFTYAGGTLQTGRPVKSMSDNTKLEAVLSDPDWEGWEDLSKIDPLSLERVDPRSMDQV